MPLTRPLVPEMSYVINEACVIKSDSDYRIDPIDHHLQMQFIRAGILNYPRGVVVISTHR